MDSHTHSLLPERLEVIEVGRRRRWSEEEKLRIVTECLEAPRLVSATARRHGITRSQLMAWRRALKVERVAPEPAPAFVPAVLVPEPTSEAKAASRRMKSPPPRFSKASRSGIVSSVIVLSGSCRVSQLDPTKGHGDHPGERRAPLYAELRPPPPTPNLHHLRGRYRRIAATRLAGRFLRYVWTSGSARGI